MAMKIIYTALALLLSACASTVFPEGSAVSLVPPPGMSVATDFVVADRIFPAGSAIGLVPPPGMSVAAIFSGFRDQAHGAAITLMRFPADAFYQTVAGFADDSQFALSGITLLRRQKLTIGDDPAFLAVGERVVGGATLRVYMAVVGSPDGTAVVDVIYPEAAMRTYPDAVIRAALMTISVRPELPLTEQVAALPFTLPADLGKFRVVRIISGLIAGLTDGPDDMDPDDMQTDFIVTVSSKVPPEELRQTAARLGFQDQGRYKQVIGVDSESLITVGGLPAYQTIGRMRNERGIELKTVQWEVFGSDKTLLLDATSRPERFDLIWQQLVTIRDGVHLK
jgi:hypothetical protein